MTGNGSDGFTYRLVGWALRIEGPESVAVPETSDEPVTVTLKTGSYTVALDGDWRGEDIQPALYVRQRSLWKPDTADSEARQALHGPRSRGKVAPSPGPRTRAGALRPS
jgi:hypothetical protein